MDPVGVACWEILLASLFPPFLQYLLSTCYMSGRGLETSHETTKTSQTLSLTSESGGGRGKKTGDFFLDPEVPH